MSKLDDLLHQLRLEQYAEPIQGAGLDPNTMADEDLKKLGIPVGHRKKILEGLQDQWTPSKLKAAPLEKLPAIAAKPSTPAPAAPPSAPQRPSPPALPPKGGPPPAPEPEPPKLDPTIANLLHQLQLSQYANNFCGKELDLAKATDEDLKKLGVPMGARKKILDELAIQVSPSKIKTAKAAALPGAPNIPSSSSPVAPAAASVPTVVNKNAPKAPPPPGAPRIEVTPEPASEPIPPAVVNTNAPLPPPPVSAQAVHFTRPKQTVAERESKAKALKPTKKLNHHFPGYHAIFCPKQHELEGNDSEGKCSKCGKTFQPANGSPTMIRCKECNWMCCRACDNLAFHHTAVCQYCMEFYQDIDIPVHQVICGSWTCPYCYEPKPTFTNPEARDKHMWNSCNRSVGYVYMGSSGPSSSPGRSGGGGGGKGCGACSGSGKSMCNWCKGSGDWQKKPCTHCKGGYNKCIRCNGRG